MAKSMLILGALLLISQSFLLCAAAEYEDEKGSYKSAICGLMVKDFGDLNSLLKSILEKDGVLKPMTEDCTTIGLLLGQKGKLCPLLKPLLNLLVNQVLYGLLGPKSFLNKLVAGLVKVLGLEDGLVATLENALNSADKAVNGLVGKNSPITGLLQLLLGNSKCAKDAFGVK